ncbi:ABC transporter permease [Alphaproteobacteria bacterium]|nr:ABC transporter permease [Alphaproteobacteria bacterium]
MRRKSVVHIIGVARLRDRYARSKLGQTWLVLSQLLNIILFGSVWSVIWQQPLDQHLPYIGVGFIIYAFLGTTLNEACNAIIGDSQYYLNSKVPFFLSVFAHVYRNFLIFLNNLPSIFLLVLWSDSAFMKFDVGWIFGVILCFIFVSVWTYIIAATCVRFRDLVQIYGVIFQTAFLVSPVMWKLDFVPSQFHNYFLLNPLAAGLEILRNPWIGMEVASFAYISLIVWCIVGLLASNFVYIKLDKKLSLWL